MSALAQVVPDAREYDQVAVGELDTCYAALRLPSPEAVAALARSIARHGVLHPLTVNREGDALAVLDGLKRVQALADKPDVSVPVRVVRLTPPQAKAALVTFNRPHRGLCDLEEAWIVQTLVRDHEMRQKEVAELLGRHKSWVCRRLQLAQRLEAGVVDDMRLGLISATVARELVRLPRGNQPRVAAAVQRHGLTSRQSAELVGRVLHAPDEQGVAELLDDPMRFIESPPSRAGTARDARLSQGGDALRRSLDRLARQARITERTIHSPRIGLLVCSDEEVLRPHVRDVLQTLELILATLRQFLGDGESNA